jgi:hypothetical protein
MLVRIYEYKTPFKRQCHEIYTLKYFWILLWILLWIRWDITEYVLIPCYAASAWKLMLFLGDHGPVLWGITEGQDSTPCGRAGDIGPVLCGITEGHDSALYCTCERAGDQIRSIMTFKTVDDYDDDGRLQLLYYSSQCYLMKT